MRTKHFLSLLGGCILFTFIYSPSRLYFLSDDWDSLLFSLTPTNILHSFRPLSDASLWLDYSVWKMNSTGFHFTNLILHFSCVFCFYEFSKKLFGLRNDSDLASKLALVSSFLFLFYPFHSEALFWIVGRGAILCTLFGLLCLIFYLQKEKSWLYYFLSVACFAAALLSYEEAWVIPVIITVLSFIYKPPSKRISFFQLTGFWVIFLLYISGRYFFTNSFIGTPYGSERIMDFNFLLLCKNFLALLFRSVVIPLKSSVIFSIACAIVAFVFSIVLLITRKKINLVLIGSAICFFISLLPVVPLGIDTHDTESERFLYFPSLFFLLFFVQLFHLFLKRNLWLTFVVLIMEIFVLWKSYDSFVISSFITHTTMTALGKTGSVDTLYCTKLPEQYEGAFIFRNGFKSAVKLVKKDSIKNVTILSTAELYDPQKNYNANLDSSFQPKLINKNNIYVEWSEREVSFHKDSFK